MKKEGFLLTSVFFLFLFILLSFPAILTWPTVEPPANCENCPPSLACNISCNRTILDRETATHDYFNFTITDYTDVLLVLKGFGDCIDYDMYMKKISQYCPTQDDADWGKIASEGAPEARFIVNLGPGEYYILINNSNDLGFPCDRSYNFNLSCGRWCGNGVVDDFGVVHEACDPYAPPSQWNCEPYDGCNVTCQCEDFRPRMIGCDYYDYCVNGTRVGSIESCCIEIVSGSTAPCCKLGGNPSDCSDPMAVRNESVIVRNETCYAADYDITDVCIDMDYNPQYTWRTC